MAARGSAARRRDDASRTPGRILEEAIATRRARVGVVGLGYVGLPLACTFAEGRFPVVGFDADAEKVRVLRAGGTYIRHVPATRIAALRGALERVIGAEPGHGRFAATSDLVHLGACDAVLVCVPTPLTAAREPDLSCVEASMRAVARTLRPGQLVVL